MLIVRWHISLERKTIEKIHQNWKTSYIPRFTYKVRADKN